VDAKAPAVMARPYVLINVAATVDGKIDTFERRGAAISSERDRERVDRLRASVDAVMVGGRTLLQEDPRLTVRSADLRAERLARGEPENPAKVGVLSRLDPSNLPPAEGGVVSPVALPATEGGIASRVVLRADCRFLTAGPARIILFAPDGSDAVWLRGRSVEVYANGASRVDLVWALSKLFELGIRRVLVEGGGTLNFELLHLGLVDEVQVYTAPLIFGGAAAPTLADGPGLPRHLAINLQRLEVEPWPDGGVLLRYMVEQKK
jgi:2,5-diamino-6-(ribosylamino)-4(3H)-pyrimidinone 5'-phosphate reductase